MSSSGVPCPAGKRCRRSRSCPDGAGLGAGGQQTLDTTAACRRGSRRSSTWARGLKGNAHAVGASEPTPGQKQRSPAAGDGVRPSILLVRPRLPASPLRPMRALHDNVPPRKPGRAPSQQATTVGTAPCRRTQLRVKMPTGGSHATSARQQWSTPNRRRRLLLLRAHARHEPINGGSWEPGDLGGCRDVAPPALGHPPKVVGCPTRRRVHPSGSRFNPRRVQASAEKNHCIA
jgi:hypothetical protein